MQPVDLQKTLEEFRRFSEPRSGKAPERFEAELREIAGDHLTLERNEIGLGKAIQELTHIKDHAWAQMKIETTKDVVKGLEIRNMALTGVMVAQAALARRESRGQHQRKDFPARDDGAWLRWIILKKEGGDISVTDEMIT